MNKNNDNDYVKSLFAATMEALDVPAAIQTNGFVYRAVNEAYRKEFFNIFGIEVNVGDHMDHLLGHLPDELTNAKQLWQRAFNGESLTVTREFGDPSRLRRTYDITFKPLYGNDQKIIAVIQYSLSIASSPINQQLLKEKKDQEQIFKNALDSMLDGVIIFDPNGNISYHNQQANTILHNSIRKMHRQELLDTISFQDEEGNLLPVDEIPSSKAFRGERSTNKILKLTVRNHEPMWVHSSTAPIYNDQKELLGVILNFRDITLEVKSREALRESELKFHTMADSISQLAWMADEKGDIFWYNKRWFEYTGTKPEEVKGWGWMKIHHPNHLDRVVAKFKKSLISGNPWQDIFPLKGRDGNYRWFLSRALPVHDSHGNIIYWFGTNTDITENKILEEKLKNEHDLLQKIIDNIPVMISIYEPDINVTYLNKEIEKVTGWTNKDAEKYGIMNLAYPDTDYREFIAEYMKSLKPGFMDIKMTCKSGEIKDTAWANIHIRDGRSVGIGIDLTNIKKYENDLLRANQVMQQTNEQLERFNKLLENLLFMAAHDLKSPIGNLQLMLYLISTEESLEKKLQYLPDFQKMVVRLNNVIDGLIEIIESQQDDHSLIARDISVESIVEDVKNDLKEDLAKCGGEIRLNLNDVSSIGYIGAFLESILKNLLSNAIKYRHPDRNLIIDISVERKENFVVMTFKDNGIGFDAVKNSKNLFRPFKRFTSTGSGTGIGLYIVKSFIEKNGGYIDVESTINEGTAFYCHLKEHNIGTVKQ